MFIYQKKKGNNTLNSNSTENQNAMTKKNYV